MKTEYKYMTMKLVKDTGKTTVWNIINKRSGAILGAIGWYPAWREYVFYTVNGILFNNSCLSDIQDFIRQLMAHRRIINAAVKGILSGDIKMANDAANEAKAEND